MWQCEEEAAVEIGQIRTHHAGATNAQGDQEEVSPFQSAAQECRAAGGCGRVSDRRGVGSVGHGGHRAEEEEDHAATRLSGGGERHRAGSAAEGRAHCRGRCRAQYSSHSAHEQEGECACHQTIAQGRRCRRDRPQRH